MGQSNALSDIDLALIAVQGSTVDSQFFVNKTSAFYGEEKCFFGKISILVKILRIIGKTRRHFLIFLLIGRWILQIALVICIIKIKKSQKSSMLSSKHRQKYWSYCANNSVFFLIFRANLRKSAKTIKILKNYLDFFRQICYIIYVENFMHAKCT